MVMIKHFQLLKYRRSHVREGSVLVFTLFIMLVMTIMAIGMFSVSFMNYGMSISTGRSVSSLQTADTAVEFVLQAMRDVVQTDDRSIGNVASLMCPSNECACSVSSGVAQISDLENTYEITFRDKALNDYLDSCTISILDVKTIRAVGNLQKGELRVIEVEPHINPCSIANELSSLQQNPVTEDYTAMLPSKAVVACGELDKNSAGEYKIDSGIDRVGDVCPWHVPTLDQLKIFASNAGLIDGRYYWTNTPKHTYSGCTEAMSWKSFRFASTEDLFCYEYSDILTKDPVPVDLLAYVRCVR